MARQAGTAAALLLPVNAQATTTRRSATLQTKPTNSNHKLTTTMSTPYNTTDASDELNDAQLETIAGGFLDATGTGSSVLGDGIFCVGGGLINSKMEVNL